MKADDTVFNMKTNSKDDASSNKFHLCRVARPMTILTYTKKTVLASCQGVEIMTSETNGHDRERWCSMTLQGQIKILHGKPLNNQIGNLTAKPVNPARLMVVAYVLPAPPCIIHASDEKLHLSKDVSPIPLQCNKFHSDRTAYAVSYKLPEGCSKHADNQMQKMN